MCEFDTLKFDINLELQTTSSLWLFQLDDSNLYMGNGWESPNIHQKLVGFWVPGAKNNGLER